jgi:phosphatidylglycerophosphatase A
VTRAAAVSGLGLGYLRPAPGSWGSLPPPAVALGLVWLLGRDGLTAIEARVVDGAMIALALLGSTACIAFGAWAESHYGRKDPSNVVADEIAGQAVALIALPWGAALVGRGLLGAALLAAGAFLAFRALDVVKPPPARGIQRLSAGWGILADDLVAGAYALIVVQAVARIAV